MAIIVNYETGGDSDEPIGDLGGDEYDLAQSFTMPAADSVVNKVQLYLKKQNTITDPITVRIETNSGSTPSGTLVNASATSTVTPTSTSYDWLTITFPASFTLSASTKYWIKCTVPNQSTNNCYFWFRDVSSGYAGGGESLSFNGGAFGAESASVDLYFRVYSADEFPSSPIFFGNTAIA